MNEFSPLLESYIIKTGSLLIAGDFNFHVDDTSDAVAANFLGLLESFDLRQHVHSYTHIAGHTLDLVISRSAESILNVTSVDDSSIISDHYTVCVGLQFVQPSWERKRIRARELKAIDIEQFKQDIGLLLYWILLVTYLGFSTCLTQNYLAYLINMPHLNRAWLPSALLLHGEEIKLERRIRRRLERK